jgi:hypothetical protein
MEDSVVNLTLRQLYFRGKSPQYKLNRGWVHPTSGLNVVKRRKICYPCPDPNPGSPSL